MERFSPRLEVLWPLSLGTPFGNAPLCSKLSISTSSLISKMRSLVSGPAATPETLTGDARKLPAGLFNGLILPFAGDKSLLRLLPFPEIPEFGADSLLIGESATPVFKLPSLNNAPFDCVSLDRFLTWLVSCVRKDCDLRWF